MIADVSWASQSRVSYRDGKENFVAQIFSHDGRQVAMLNLRNHQLGRKGLLLNTFRWAKSRTLSESVKVKTGEIKVTKNEQGLVVGTIVDDSQMLNAAVFQSYGGVMAGDEVEMKDTQIVAKTVVAPELTVPFTKLFSNPSRYNQSFELSGPGMRELGRVAGIYGGMRSSKLIIEGHTDSVGDSNDNQVESLQRAMAIKHLLADHFGFDSTRLVALGFGETEPVDEVYYPGVERVNRRIVFRISHE